MPGGIPQSNPFEQFDSNRPSTSTADIESQQSGFSIGGTLNAAKAFVIGRPEPEPQGWLSVFNFLPNDASYCNAAIAFGIAGFFLILAIFLVFSIVLAPSKFVMCFSMAMMSMMVGLAFLNGPRVYIKKLFVEKNLVASIVLIASILLSLWFSMIMGSYLLSLLFCVMQLNAILYFFCKTSAFNLGTIKWIF